MIEITPERTRIIRTDTLLQAHVEEIINDAIISEVINDASAGTIEDYMNGYIAWLQVHVEKITNDAKLSDSRSMCFV